MDKACRVRVLSEARTDGRDPDAIRTASRVILVRWLRLGACLVRGHALPWPGFDLATGSSEVCLDMSLDATFSEPPGDELPDIDERLVAPETRYEIWDGKLVYVPPADPPHGELH